MTGSPVLAVPFAVQASAMAVDELYFHRKRGLERWERVGHPLDTLTVVACLGWVLFVRPGGASALSYVALAIVSCLFVTKDEWIHARCCTPGEHWVHALLFVVHPVTLAAAGVLWPALHGRSNAYVPWIAGDRYLAGLVAVQFALTAAFAAYQIGYWNLGTNRGSRRGEGPDASGRAARPAVLGAGSPGIFGIREGGAAPPAARRSRAR